MLTISRPKKRVSSEGMVPASKEEEAVETADSTKARLAIKKILKEEMDKSINRMGSMLQRRSKNA